MTAVRDRRRRPQPSSSTEPDPDGPLVGIIMGSQSDMETMQKAGKVLEEAEVTLRDRASCRRTATPTRSPSTAAPHASAG